MEEDILKFAVNYNLQEDETERGKLRVEREYEWVEWTMA